MAKQTIIKKLSIVVSSVLLLSSIASAFAWLTGNKEIEVDDMQGSIIAQYFHCGTGTQADPFVITRPNHYYNLVNLYQRLDGFSNEPYYFQLGIDLNGDGNPDVYNYDNDGNRITTPGSEYTTSLNLKYFSGDKALLPIGTSEKPFVGTFNGQGLTISNLTVKGSENYGGSTTYSSADIGIWGFISGPVDKDGNPIMVDSTDENGNSVEVPQMASISNVYYDRVTIDLTGADKDAICQSTKVHDSDYVKDPEKVTADAQDTIYVGVIAGHITTDTSVKDVYINHCTIVGGAPATCNFGYFGCVENASDIPATGLGSLVADLRGKGNEAGFGGSLEMDKLYSRVNSIRTLARNNIFRYDANKTVTIDKVAGTITYTYPNPATGTLQNYYIGYSIDGGGTYIYFNRTDTDAYTYMSSTSATQTTSAVTYTYVANGAGTDYLYDDAFILSDGAVYLDADGTTLTTANTQANAQPFVWEGSYIYTRVDGEKLYLNANGTSGVILSATKSTSWTKNGANELSTVIGGTTYYLDYNNGWKLNSLRTVYRLGDGTNYLVANNNSTVVNTTDAAAATNWILSNPTGNTTISYRSGNNTYYLGYNNNGALTISTTQTTWNKDGSAYYVTIGGERFYLVYDGGWKLALRNSQKLHDGNGHYLSANTTTVQNAAENAAIEWVFSDPTGATTQIYSVINGIKYYLRYNNGLTVGTTAQTWNRNGSSYYYTSGGTDYYLTYENGWKVVPITYQTISDGSGNYLRVTSNNAFANTTNVGDATHFYFSNTAGNPSGTVYAIVNGTTYYLYNNNGTLATTTNSGTATNWANDGSSLSYTNNGLIYAIRYNGTWNIQTINNGTLITDGNGNYLRVTGTGQTSFENTRDQSLATRFTFSNGSAGTISTNYNGTTVYLRNNSNSLRLQTGTGSTSWSNDGNNISNNNRYIVFNNGTWQLSQTRNETSPKYKISTGGNYMAYTMNNGTPTLTSTTDANAANVILWNENTGNISTTIDGTTYYLTSNTTDGAALALSTTQNTATWNSPRNYGTYRYFSVKTGGLFGIGATTYRYWIVYNGGWKNVRTSDDNNQHTNASSLTFTNQDVTTNYYSRTEVVNETIPTISVSKETLLAPQITVQNINRTPVTNVYEVPVTYPLGFADAKLQVIEKVVTTEKTGTYFPIRIGADDEGGATNDYTASQKNTGYIIGGAYDQSTPSSSRGWSVKSESGTTSNSFKSTYSADIRISQYGTGDIDNSYANNAFTKIYTVDGSGSREMTTDEKNSDTYKVASKQFLDTLKGQSNVYGLHFMNAEISMDHMIVAKQATILGKTYYNYQFPEDCIDFHTVERGTINFFAGTYFDGNNAFFSLHQIYRDGDENITAIKEISKVYADSELGSKRPYIYLYKDGTYSGAGSLPSGYTEVFNTAYITNPSGVSKSNRLYYFEIPCNAGEFALGSVSGKTGAYLCYLDIATNGGAVLSSVISSEGNDVTSSFKVDVRSEKDEKEQYAILQYAVTVPNDATNTNFSVEVSFDSSAKGTNDPTLCSKGLYTLNVVNKTGSDIEISIFLVDDDKNLNNAFPYAYQIVYTNASKTNAVLETTSGYDVWKSVASFRIPATGAAEESSYTS